VEQPEGLPELNAALASAGYTLVPIPKDGNCLFTSFAVSLRGHGPVSPDVAKADGALLRAVSCEFMVLTIATVTSSCVFLERPPPPQPKHAAPPT
jgi:hypothetical protein